MHTLNGSAASVSADSTANGGNASAFHKHHRSSSRPSSVSSASIVTVKRPGSFNSSGTGARNSVLPIKAQNPTETSLIALRLGRESVSHDHQRRKSVAVDPTERSSGDGPDGFNRLSHSTSSSIASIGNANTRRSRASSGAILQPLANAAFSSPKKNWPPIDHSPRASPQKRATTSRPSSRKGHSPTSSPERERQRQLRPDITTSLTALPPLQPIPALTDPNDTESPSTIPTVATPQSSYGQDYFGDDTVSPRSNAKSKKPSLTRNHIASMSAGGSTRAEVADITQEAVLGTRDGDVQTNGTSTSRGVETSDHQDESPMQPPPREERRHRRTRTQERSERDKKQMLSRALQKANTAVLLDNAQNFEGALEAYSDACRLLQQVMDRSSGVEDRRKLDAIRVTYTNRMEELRQLESAQPEIAEGKSLPARPMSDDSLPLSPASAVSPTIESSLENPATVETLTPMDEVDVPRLSSPEREHDSFLSDAMQAVQESSKKESEKDVVSTQPEPIIEEDPVSPNQFDFGESFSKLELDLQTDQDTDAESEDFAGIPPLNTNGIHLPLPGENEYMPAPLSPRRPLSPKLAAQADRAWQDEPGKSQQVPPESSFGLDNNDGPVSWLNTIEESGSSRASSVHSMSSQHELRRKHLRSTSDEANPDLDAAFDAAVEAAYDQGLEPDLESRSNPEPAHQSHAHGGSIAVRSSQIKEISPPIVEYQPNTAFPLAPEDEEEERLLDYITQDYAQGFNFDLSTKSALPRQSDSSGYSRSTWQSSQNSERTTAGTSLSTVAEDAQPSPESKNAFLASTSLNIILADPPPPPTAPPQTSLPRIPSASQNRASGVRSRRLSGQNPKQLKIQTSSESEARKRASTVHNSGSAHDEDTEKHSAIDNAFKFGARLEPTVSEKQHDLLLRSPPSLDLRSAVSDTSRPMTATTVTTDQRTSLDDDPSELTIHRPPIKKNQSSISLREHMVLLASPTVEHGPSVLTPMSSTFMTFAAKQRNNETLLTSQRANLPSFGATATDTVYTGGVYLFDTSLSNVQYPTSPRSPVPNQQPTGLEPCPESFLLRPFWLMRTVASTLTHPKGGFLTSRLFVPREVWLTRGVKLKSVEDKIANCDLLTAALGRLAGVDTYDADAVMEELQNFEEVMERVQSALVKRLGSDVGISGLAGIFKDAVGSTMSSGASTYGSDLTMGAEKTRSKESKGYLNSWRKLRSKSSGAPITSAQTNRATSRAAEKELPSMDSVPMTSYVPVERRGQKKDARNLIFEGPNREYMGSLARLFEGVQVLDQIARQVVDPGLKGTSQTHVGLELSIRHAAEFFCFYVCRFVLADVGTLLDKFVKRGTEWVLA